MGWKNWPYWLRGGIILSIIYLIFEITARNTQSQYLALLSLIISTILLAVPITYLVQPFSSKFFNVADTILFKGAGENITPSIYGLILLFIIIFLIGAFIGWIVRLLFGNQEKVGKVKKTKEKNGFGITGLTLGILSILSILLSPLIGVILGILGIIFSVKQRKIYSNGISTTGLITSIIGVAISIFLLIIFLIFF